MARWAEHNASGGAHYTTERARAFEVRKLQAEHAAYPYRGQQENLARIERLLRDEAKRLRGLKPEQIAARASHLWQRAKEIYGIDPAQFLRQQ